MKGPILKLGSYGTHIIKNPAGTFSFVGTVPEPCDKISKTFEDAIEVFFVFFRSMPIDWQRENIGNMRNDIFVKFISN